MAVFAIALALQAAGGLIRLKGQLDAEEEEVKALYDDADFFEEQAEFTEAAGDRKEKLLVRQMNILMGDQLSSFAKNGVDLSGSALAQTVDSQGQFQDEIEAARIDNAFSAKLTRIKAETARKNAGRIRKKGFMDRVGTILGVGGNMASIANSQRSSSSSKSFGVGDVSGGTPIPVSDANINLGSV